MDKNFKDKILNMSNDEIRSMIKINDGISGDIIQDVLKDLTENFKFDRPVECVEEELEEFYNTYDISQAFLAVQYCILHVFGIVSTHIKLPLYDNLIDDLTTDDDISDHYWKPEAFELMADLENVMQCLTFFVYSLRINREDYADILVKWFNDDKALELVAKTYKTDKNKTLELVYKLIDKYYRTIKILGDIIVEADEKDFVYTEKEIIEYFVEVITSIVEEEYDYIKNNKIEEGGKIDTLLMHFIEEMSEQDSPSIQIDNFMNSRFISDDNGE